ncbi:hypothetical protein HDU98_008381 [Podochytrium sp. JEL0797]|nr:hypothetical protein HDU98_008381 [Podochytrium sp. JEL0797]
MEMQQHNNILILIDELSDAKAAIESGLSHLHYYCSGSRITIVKVVSSTQEQKSALAETTALLRSFRDLMHPETRFNVYIVPQERAHLDWTISTFVQDVRPNVLVFALSVCDSLSVTKYYYAELKKGNSVDVTYLKAEGESEEVSDEEDTKWRIQNSARCASPEGWD